MLLELSVIVVVAKPDSSVLDCSVHPCDLSIRLRMHRLGQSMFDVEVGASRVEGVATEENTLGPHRLDVFGRSVAVAAGRICRTLMVPLPRSTTAGTGGTGAACGGGFRRLCRLRARSMNSAWLDATYVKARRSAHGAKGAKAQSIGASRGGRITKIRMEGMGECGTSEAAPLVVVILPRLRAVAVPRDRRSPHRSLPHSR